MSRGCQGQERLGGTESARSSDRSLSAQLSRRGWRGVRYLIVEALCSGTGAFYAPHSRLGWRRTHMTPGCHPGLHEAAASQLYTDGPSVASRRVTHVNRSIRSSRLTHNTASGNVLVYWNNSRGGSPEIPVEPVGVSPLDNVPYSRPGIDQGGCCRPLTDSSRGK